MIVYKFVFSCLSEWHHAAHCRGRSGYALKLFWIRCITRVCLHLDLLSGSFILCVLPTYSVTLLWTSISAWPHWLSWSNLYLLPLYLHSSKYYFITPATFLHVFQPACSLHPPLLWVIATVVHLCLKAIKNTCTVAFLTLTSKAKMCLDEDIIFSPGLH